MKRFVIMVNCLLGMALSAQKPLVIRNNCLEVGVNVMHQGDMFLDGQSSWRPFVSYERAVGDNFGIQVGFTTGTYFDNGDLSYSLFETNYPYFLYNQQLLSHTLQKDINFTKFDLNTKRYSMKLGSLSPVGFYYGAGLSFANVVGSSYSGYATERSSGNKLIFEEPESYSSNSLLGLNGLIGFRNTTKFGMTIGAELNFGIPIYSTEFNGEMLNGDRVFTNIYALFDSEVMTKYKSMSNGPNLRFKLGYLF